MFTLQYVTAQFLAITFFGDVEPDHFLNQMDQISPL